MAKKTWCIPELTDEFVEQMNEILDLYELPYNPKEPQICFDEKSKQLIADLFDPLPMKPGMPKRIDSEYVRNGTANVFMMVEPKAGKRYTIVKRRRTAIDFAECIEELAKLYLHADKIHVILDNLNTHKEESLYKKFGEKAKILMEKIVFHHTPRHGSWLNMAELEIGIMENQCLKRRIPNIEFLKKELAAWQNNRNEKEAKINWTFTKEKAKEKFKL